MAQVRALPCSITVTAGLILLPITSEANDFAPYDYTPAPPGTNIAIAEYVYGHFGAIDLPGQQSAETHVEQHIAILEYGRYGEVLGRTYGLALKLPYIGMPDASLAGSLLHGQTGIGDPIAVAALWPLSQPDEGRYVAVASFTSIPVGEYEPGRALNAGSRRWQEDVQIDFHQE